MPYPTTRRHPRTLQEAFGPHASRDIQPIPEPGLLERLLNALTPEGLFMLCCLSIAGVAGVLMLVGVIA
jgi:hypothetical protein